jgi:hypothetical protein
MNMMAEELTNVGTQDPTVLFRNQIARLKQFQGMPCRHAKNFDAQGRIKIAKVSPHQLYRAMHDRATTNAGGAILK